jgi:hypothetical protein
LNKDTPFFVCEKVLSLHPNIYVERFEPLATTEKNAKNESRPIFRPSQVQ